MSIQYEVLTPAELRARLAVADPHEAVLAEAEKLGRDVVYTSRVTPFGTFPMHVVVASPNARRIMA